MSLTVNQAYLDLLSKLGITDVTLSTALIQQDIVVALNWAGQTLQAAGQDYFTREMVTITVGAGTAAFVMAKTMQAVIGPLRWNDLKPLRALQSRGEWDQYARIFAGSIDYGQGSGEPDAYWVQSTKSGSSGDISLTTILLAPTPIGAGTLVAEIVNDWTAYTTTDLTSSTAIPVAQNYTESIFLPLARMAITRSQQFSRPDLLEQLTADGQVALQRLGMSGGFPNAVQPEPERVVNG